MKYQTISISIHEKRNHPHEYGHFDAEVSFAVQVEEGDDPDTIAVYLRAKARFHVEAELDAKVAQVNLEEERKDARSSLHWLVVQAKNNPYTEFAAQDFEERLHILPDDEQTEWRAKLDKAKEECWALISEGLEELISRAERNTVSSFDIDRFNIQAVYLPEAEQDGYRKRMKAALERAESDAEAKRAPAVIHSPGINDDPAALMRQLKEDEKNIPY